MLEVLDGTMHAAANIAIGKAATAVAFQRPTKDIEDVILKGRTPMLMLYSVTPQPYVPLL
jgi:glc operon protein GlcG